MLCLTCHQPRCENLPHLHYRTFSATLTNTHTMCPPPHPPPRPLPPTEHEHRGHKAGSGKQSPARPAPGEGGQAPPAAGQVSLFPFMSFFFPHLPPDSSHLALSSLSVATQHISSVPSLSFLPFQPPLPFCPHQPPRMSNARRASHPQCLIPPCGSSLPAAARCSGTLPLCEKTSHDYACSH